MSTGRPTQYRKEHDEVAYKLALLGHDDEKIADYFGVKEQTLNNWKRKHPSFFESLTRGKVIADAEVAASMYKRATGYEYDAEKVVSDQGTPTIVTYREHIPPDPGAAKNWLANRQPKLWREKIEHTGEGGGPLEVVVTVVGGPK